MGLLVHISLATLIYCYVDKVASEEASVKIYVLVTFLMRMTVHGVQRLVLCTVQWLGPMEQILTILTNPYLFSDRILGRLHYNACSLKFSTYRQKRGGQVRLKSQQEKMLKEKDDCEL